MSEKGILGQLAATVVELNVDKAKKLASKALEAGIPAYDVIIRGLVVGLDSVGRKYETGEFFLSELIMSSVVAKAVMDVLKPRLEAERTSLIGKVVLGTVEGDLHDIGKNIVGTLLEASGFEVYDLGVDVSPRKFVEKVKEVKPAVVGMSSLLSITVPKFKETIEALEKAGVRGAVKVIIGGRSASEKVAEDCGADIYAADAVEGVRKIKSAVKSDPKPAMTSERRLQGEVVKIEKTGETRKDEERNEWNKCIFTVKITRFSKRTPEEKLPEELRWKDVKITRWCCLNWHYRLEVRETLEPEETEAVLRGDMLC